MSSGDPHDSRQYPPAGGDTGAPRGQAQGPYGYHQHGPGPYGRQHPVRVGPQPGVHVGFGAAIKRYYAKYAQFSGRASRSEYWWVALYLALITLPLELLISYPGTEPSGELNGLGVVLSFVYFGFMLAHFIPSLAIGIRRLHDVNLSGWFTLIGLIPLVGWIVIIVLAVLPHKPEGARFDR